MTEELDKDKGYYSREPGELDDDTLLRDVAFNRHSRNFRGDGQGNVWDGNAIVSPSTNSTNHVGLDGVKVRLIQGLPPEQDVAKIIWKGRAATRGLRIGDDVDAQMEHEIGEDPETWREMFKGGLQTALEAFVLVFEVSGVSRTCTHQLVRSRRAGFHQQSQRAGSYVDAMGFGPDIRTPESVWRKMQPESPEVVGDADDLAWAWQQALMWSRRAYRLACQMDVSYQDARFILPEGTENYIICEYNLREFLAVHDYRACSMFQWEIVWVTRLMGEALLKQSPWLKGTAGEPKISCEKTTMALDGGPGKHTCTFQGWERVEDQCGFDWARETNRTFKPHKSI